MTAAIPDIIVWRILGLIILGVILLTVGAWRAYGPNGEENRRRSEEVRRIILEDEAERRRRQR